MKPITFKSILLLGVLLLVFMGHGLSQDSNKSMETHYKEAKSKFQKDANEKNTIWFGRRTAYLGKYKEAIRIYTDGLKKFPDSYRLLRHRGHRYITTRQFPKAIADFRDALKKINRKPLEIEPDGLPNALNIPLSNTHFNIYYHLGLAHYVRGEFKQAISAYKECLKWSKNNDSIVATTHWLYMSLRRTGRVDEAKKILSGLKNEMSIVEDFDYYELVLAYKGIKKIAALERATYKDQTKSMPEDYKNATLWYGIGNWYLYNGDKPKALEIFQNIKKVANPAAFGSIAAEQDLLKMQKK
jgi:tetratricopeptide (TPR) repeat protein